MERFGYMIETSHGLKCSHEKLFINFVDCVKHALSHKCKVSFFQIMSTPTVISEFHSTDKQYGYIIQHLMPPFEYFTICAHSTRFFTSVLEAILESKDLSTDEIDHPSFRSKIGYFKTLSPEEIIEALHL